MIYCVCIEWRKTQRVREVKYATRRRSDNADCAHKVNKYTTRESVWGTHTLTHTHTPNSNNDPPVVGAVTANTFQNGDRRVTYARI